MEVKYWNLSAYRGATGNDAPNLKYWNLSAYRGATGNDAPNLKIQYSADGTNWHDTFTEGDLYMRTSSDDGQTWSGAMQFVQDTISDLAAIRSGAAAGATAVQPSDLATVATSGSYNDLLNKPTIPDVSAKADKVSGATNGDFAGLDANGNLTDSGKKASDFATQIPVVDASTIPASMDADKVYQYGTLSGDTTFPDLVTPSDLTVAHVYCWTFTTPATAPTITWPSAITSWAGGSAPTINASKSYEVSVMDGFATIIEN